MRGQPSKTSDWTVVRMLEWATEYFKSRDVPSPRLSIEWLLSHVLNAKRLDLYLQFDRPLTRDELDMLKPLVLRRAEHEPLQYIIGQTDFYNLTIRVTPDVLIPRPETEQLVERILADHSGEEPLRFLDIGTGSGCMALAVKKVRPMWEVTAIDISEEALRVAAQNARDHKLDIRFHLASFEDYNPVLKQDIIASNPPYIGPEDSGELPHEVSAYEPALALLASDVEDVYRKLTEFCRNHLAPGGSFYFEINEKHGDNLLLLCNSAPYKSCLLKDWSGKDRFIVGKMEDWGPNILPARDL